MQVEQFHLRKFLDITGAIQYFHQLPHSVEVVAVIGMISTPVLVGPEDLAAGVLTVRSVAPEHLVKDAMVALDI